jgi:Flp pilus assembly protein TadB
MTVDVEAAPALSSFLPVLVALGAGLTSLSCVEILRRFVRARHMRKVNARMRTTFLRQSPSGPMHALERQIAKSVAHRDAQGKMQRLLHEADINLAVGQFAVRVAAIGVIVGVGTAVGSGELLVGGLATVAVPVLAYAWLLRRRGSIQERVGVQLPDALMTIANSLLAGGSLPQGFEQAALESPRPVCALLQRAVDGYRVGRSFEAVLTDLKNEVGLPMLDVAVAAMLIARDGGGSLGELLSDAAELMRDDLRLQRDLKVATAQAKLSAQVVGALPVLIVAVLLVTSPENLAPFFATGVGKLLFVFATALELIGFLLVVRASSVRF